MTDFDSRYSSKTRTSSSERREASSTKGYYSPRRLHAFFLACWLASSWNSTVDDNKIEKSRKKDRRQVGPTSTS
jgi:hypothetical protein